jgi:hypothetical protein
MEDDEESYEETWFFFHYLKKLVYKVLLIYLEVLVEVLGVSSQVHEHDENLGQSLKLHCIQLFNFINVKSL